MLAILFYPSQMQGNETQTKCRGAEVTPCSILQWMLASPPSENINRHSKVTGISFGNFSRWLKLPANGVGFANLAGCQPSARTHLNNGGSQFQVLTGSFSSFFKFQPRLWGCFAKLHIYSEIRFESQFLSGFSRSEP